MPIPFEKGCNKLIVNDTGSKPGACVTARLAIGIGEVRPPQFAKFHDWLMSGDEEKPPIVEKSLPKAYEMAGRDRLRTYIRGEEVNKQMAQYVDLYSRLRTAPGTRSDFGLPVQILGDKVMSGMVEKEEDVFKAWEEHLGVQPALREFPLPFREESAGGFACEPASTVFASWCHSRCRRSQYSPRTLPTW